MRKIPATLSFGALSFVAALLCSCSSAVMHEPLTSSTSVEIRETLEGTWNSGDGDTLVVAFDADGKGEMAYIERSDDEFRLGKGELQAVEIEERWFLSVRIEEDGELPEEWAFTEYLLTDTGELVMWPPNYDRFEKAINDGELEGKVKKGQYGTVTITLDSKAPAVLEFLKKNPDAINSREPSVIRRLDD